MSNVRKIGREECRDCKYVYAGGTPMWLCDYICKTGHSRKGGVDWCDKYEKIETRKLNKMKFGKAIKEESVGQISRDYSEDVEDITRFAVKRLGKKKYAENFDRQD